MDAQWIKSVYGLAVKPDAIFYLRASVPGGWLLECCGGRKRISTTGSRGVGYASPRRDLFASFVEYQTRMLSVFDSMSGEIRIEKRGKIIECHSCR
jgi:hypothetical protein